MKIVTRLTDRFPSDFAPDVKSIPLIEIVKLSHRPFRDPLNRNLIFLLSSPAAWPIVSTWAQSLQKNRTAQIICLSQGAVQSVEDSGMKVAWVSEQASIEGVMSSLPQSQFYRQNLESHLKNYLVVHPCSLGTQLKQSIFKSKTGLEIRNLPVYQTKLPKNSVELMNEVSDKSGLEWFFYSGSAVINFLKLAPPLERIIELNWTLKCIGRTSIHAFESAGNYPIHPITSQDAQSLMRYQT